MGGKQDQVVAPHEVHRSSEHIEVAANVFDQSFEQSPVEHRSGGGEVSLDGGDGEAKAKAEVRATIATTPQTPEVVQKKHPARPTQPAKPSKYSPTNKYKAKDTVEVVPSTSMSMSMSNKKTKSKTNASAKHVKALAKTAQVESANAKVTEAEAVAVAGEALELTPTATPSIGRLTRDSLALLASQSKAEIERPLRNHIASLEAQLAQLQGKCSQYQQQQQQQQQLLQSEMTRGGTASAYANPNASVLDGATARDVRQFMRDSGAAQHFPHGLPNPVSNTVNNDFLGDQIEGEGEGEGDVGLVDVCSGDNVNEWCEMKECVRNREAYDSSGENTSSGA